MKRYIIFGSAIFVLAACTASNPQSEFVSSMESAGVVMNESNISEYLDAADDYCNYSFEEYNTWNYVTEAVTEVTNLDYDKIVSAHNNYCSSLDSQWISWEMVS